MRFTPPLPCMCHAASVRMGFSESAPTADMLPIFALREGDSPTCSEIVGGTHTSPCNSKSPRLRFLCGTSNVEREPECRSTARTCRAVRTFAPPQHQAGLGAVEFGVRTDLLEPAREKRLQRVPPDDAGAW